MPVDVSIPSNGHVRAAVGLIGSDGTSISSVVAKIVATAIVQCLVP